MARVVEVQSRSEPHSVIIAVGESPHVIAVGGEPTLPSQFDPPEATLWAWGLENGDAWLLESGDKWLLEKSD